MSEPIHEYTVRVTQERSKLIVVKALYPWEANQKALEQIHAEYGGWTWEPPKAGYVHVHFDVDRHDG